MVTVAMFDSCKKEMATRVSNNPPIAVAGPDQVIVLPTDSFTLDGSSSSDPDGTINEWLWTRISGPDTSNISNARDSITTVNNLVAGTYKFQLKVTDNDGLSAKDTVLVMVDDPEIDQPPVADAGPDTTITLPVSTIYLNGRKSTDPDNNISTYSWTKISGPSSFQIANANAVETEVTNLVAGIYLFELKVTDETNLSAKDTVQINVSLENHPPVASAGPDQTITLPENSATLDGSLSTDPDSNIVRFEWSKISGPASFNMINAEVAKSQVNNLVTGLYLFEIKVTDGGGLFSKDTILVKVIDKDCDFSDWPIVNFRWKEIGQLSEPRIPVIGTAGSKIVFAGGPNNLLCSWEWELSSSAVDIYDLNSRSWTTAELSKARSEMAVASINNKIFFAGGRNWEVIAPGAQYYASYATVDIYDASNNTWSVAQLSKGRDKISAATIGSKVIFAGGVYVNGAAATPLWGVTDLIDVYDNSSNSWSGARLSVARYGAINVIRGDSLYFIGGSAIKISVDNVVDVYVSTTNRWSAFTWSDQKINEFLTEAGLVGGPAAKPCGCGTTASGMVTQIGFYDDVTNRCTIGIFPQTPPDMYDASYKVVNNVTYYAGGHSIDDRGCYILSDKVYILDR